MRAVGRKQRTEVLRLPGVLVVAEKRRAAAAPLPIEAEDDQHGVAADVVVDVAPVRIPDVVHAIAAAAVTRVGEPDAGGAVGGWKREGAALRHERLDFAGRETRPEAGASRRVDESTCGL